MNVAILVPRRADNGHRDRLWKFCQQRWSLFDWPIVEGASPDGPFNRSAALNQAARDAGDWDVAVVVDADVVAHPPAVIDATEIAHAAGRMVVSHNDRVMLNRVGTEKILDGYDGSWQQRTMVEQTYTDSVSCCVAIPRNVWDAVGGFPEAFVGWGYEDSAFELAARALTGKPYIRLASTLFHLWHATSKEAANSSPTRKANAALLDRYRAAADDAAMMRALLDGVALEPSRIPRILHRTVPADTTDQVEQWWKDFGRLHPGWELRTYREPIDPADWPLTGDLFARCQNGAQKAGLIRLEILVRDGGVYVDSDVEPIRPFEPLLHGPAFAGWEDETTVPDAVLACEPNHPAFVLALQKARSVIEGGGDAYQSGPMVTTELLPNRPDVLVLPPGAFYPFHYLQKAKAADPHPPWAFVAHHWHHSWGTPEQRASIDKRQRA